MKSFRYAGIALATIVALGLPFAASAQSYCSTYTCMLQGQIYSAMSGVSFGSYQSGGFGYNTIAPFAGATIGAQVYAPQTVMPQMGYGSPASQYQYQSQQQYQQQYAPMNYSYQPQYTQPNYYSGNSGYTYNGGSLAPYNNGLTYPYATSYQTGYTDAFGNPLCHWSDYPDNASCASDPQQHIFDPYTGTWY